MKNPLRIHYTAFPNTGCLDACAKKIFLLTIRPAHHTVLILPSQRGL